MARQPNLPGTNKRSTSNLGKNFEAELKAAHDFYREKGWVDVSQNTSQWEFVPDWWIKKKLADGRINGDMYAKTPNGSTIARVKSEPDFAGGGANFSIKFDAKESRGNSIPLGNFKPDQIHRLKLSAKCGGVTGFMVKMSEHERVFFISEKFVAEKYEAWMRLKNIPGKNAPKGTASISIAELEEFGKEIKRHRINGLWDWFPVLIQFS